MTAKVPPKPSLVAPVLALLIIILFAYLIMTDLESKRTEHTITPPIEIVEPPEQLPLTVIKEKNQATDREKIIQREAKQFVENLSPESKQPVTVAEHDDQFVRHDSRIILPDREHRSATTQSLLNDKSLDASTPITLDFTTQEQTTTTLKKLQHTIEDQTIPLTIVTQDGQQITAPLADIINRHQIPLNKEIILITQNKHHLQTTISKLRTLNIPADQAMNVTIDKGSQTLSISELLPETAEKDASGALFYLHRVTKQDKQGLWGIIQSGLITKFRQGLPIKGLYQNKDIVKAVIPADADEKLPSGMSSFLGKILQNKVKTSYIYNFYTKKMGRDPNIIHPGQQLILIEFSPEELIKIYHYFSDKRSQETKTYAVPD